MPRGVAVVRGGLAPLVDDETVRLHRRVEEDIHRGLGERWRDTPGKREGEGGGSESGGVEGNGSEGGGSEGGGEVYGGGKARRSSDQQLATTTTQMTAPQAGIT